MAAVLEDVALVVAAFAGVDADGLMAAQAVVVEGVGAAGGAMTADAARRKRSVTAAIALNRMSELGQGVYGSWLPGKA
ncbi:hypothetical protein [Streptomyces phaeochromogenes]